MMSALLDGRALTAKELAASAGVTPQTASGHLAKLIAARLITVERQGRNHYHRLASADIARMLESMMSVAEASEEARRTPIRVGPKDEALRPARTCCDHLGPARREARVVIDHEIRRNTPMAHVARRSHISSQIRLGWVAVALAVGCHSAPAWAQTALPNVATEGQPTEAGVIATDEHWSLAELTGDTAYLDQLLLPKYRSVNADGSAISKAQIVAGAAKHTGTDIETATRKITAYRKEHPYETSVALYKNVAIASFYDPARGPQKGVRSSDVLIYVAGRWHAIYSQHSAAEIPAK